MKPSGAAKLAGVVGWPIAHSLSPCVHGHWLREYAIDGQYLALPARREDFSVVLKGLVRAGFKGVNVTVPHKEAAFALSHTADAAAQAAGAANLLLFTAEGKFEAGNTDVQGLRASLEDALGPEHLKNRRAVLIGAGGAARAALLALDALGVGEIVIANRTRDRAVALVAAFSGQVRASLAPVRLAELPGAIGDPGILINASSAGMKGEAVLKFDPGILPKECVVCDLVYNPIETDLLGRASAAGLRTVDGLGMLMHQAVPSFEALFGVRPKVTPALRQTLEEALKS